MLVCPFFSFNPTNNRAYTERNYISILEEFNFELIENKQSLRKSQGYNVRRLVFLKLNLFNNKKTNSTITTYLGITSGAK